MANGLDSGARARIQQVWLVNQCVGVCLHVGCGERPISRAINIDPNPSRAPWRDFDYDVHDLPYPDEHFGSIVSSHVLPALQNIDKAMHEMHRVLKVGGKWAHVIPDWSNAPKRCDPRYYWQYQHQGWYSPDEFREWMEQYKDLFRLQTCEHFPDFKHSFRVIGLRL